MNPTCLATSNHHQCRRCGHGNPDIRLLGCSCLLHTRCLPLSLVIDQGAPYQYGGIPTPVSNNALSCPVCRFGTINGIQLLPMDFNDFDKAVALRSQAPNTSFGDFQVTSVKRTRDGEQVGDSFHRHNESYSTALLLSHSKGSGSRDHHNDRTGRWSSEEVNFVDQIVAAFDQGALPLPHGVKLNEFLGDMLLCKSSRLTKKMKNAKLSMRSFTLQNVVPLFSDEQCVTMSLTLEKFLSSVSSEALQLELKFNMTKLWRTHFSNLCLQIGYELLDASQWLATLEEMERRASDTEDIARAARRRRMGLALRQDVGPDCNAGVFVGGLPANRGAIAPLVSSSDLQMSQPSSFLTKTYASNDDVAFPENTVEGLNSVTRTRTLSEDFLSGFEDLEDPINMMNDPQPTPENKLGDCGLFLQNVIRYIETNNLPFEHVDVWVPSHVPEASTGDANSESIRLYHAGFVTRSDIDPRLCVQFNEYGTYSTNFSFAPGIGLPGRVYSSGMASWERQVHLAESARFERAGGAQVYGVQTAAGLPLSAPIVGRIVLALYSINDMEENKELLGRLSFDLARWVPEPKWKLVVELGETNNPEQTTKDAIFANMQSESVNTSDFHCDETSNEKSISGTETEVEIEQRIATMLGDYIPLNEGADNGTMLHTWMHLRLLLLRPSNRRTCHENELLDIIKQSYKGYSKDNKRKDSELANLLVRDWMFLSANSGQNIQSAPVVQQHSPLFAPMATPHIQPLQVATMGSFYAQGEVKTLQHWRHASNDDCLDKANESIVRSERSREVSPTIVPDG